MNFVNRGYTRLATAKSSEVETTIFDIEENFKPIAFVESLVEPSRANESENYAKNKECIRRKHVGLKFSSWYASTEDDGRNPESILVSYKALHSVSMNYRDSLRPLSNDVFYK